MRSMDALKHAIHQSFNRRQRVAHLFQSALQCVLAAHQRHDSWTATKEEETALILGGNYLRVLKTLCPSRP